MIDSTLYTEFVKLVPVIIGALLAISGGLGSQLIIHKLTVRREVEKYRRERLETLVKAVYSHGQWLEEKHRLMVFRNEDHDIASPLNEARMIQSLHFPELSNEILAVQRAAIPLMKFINTERLKHMADKKTFIEGWNPDEFNEGYQVYLNSVATLTNKCRKLFEATKGS